MQALKARIWLVAASSLLAHASWAQRTPVAPLAPAKVVGPVLPTRAANAVVGQPVGPAAPAPAAGATYTPPRPGEQPVYLVNARIIIGEKSLGTVIPRTIQSVEVYKAGNMPAKWRSVAPHGIINFTFAEVPRRLKPRPLASLRRQLKLTGPVRFELDGLPLEDTSLCIDKRAIAELAVRPAELGGLGVIVNIRMAPAGPDRSKRPPGTILVRGVVGR